MQILIKSIQTRKNDASCWIYLDRSQNDIVSEH